MPCRVYGGRPPGRVGRLAWLPFLACSWLAIVTSPASARCVSLGLVFSIDASSSIDEAEYAVQLSGVAEALRHPDVLLAIEANGGIKVAAVVWSAKGSGVDIVPWSFILSVEDADAFGRDLAALPRRGNGGTDLGYGVSASLDMFERSDVCMRNRVIDLSGDGRETIEPRRKRLYPLYKAVQRASTMGVTINGLAIVDGSDPGIETYYLEQLATGPLSFVMSVNGVEDFAAAMRIKLLREIVQATSALNEVGGELALAQ